MSDLSKRKDEKKHYSGRSSGLTPQQLGLFEQPSFHTLVRDVSAAMNQAVKNSGLSRDQVVDKMNELAARHGIKLNGKGGLSKDTFEKWLNIEEEARMPSIKGLSVFCAVLGTNQPLAVMASLLGSILIEGSDITLLRWAKRYHQAKDLRKQMRELEAEIS